MNWPSQSTINAVIRHGVTAGATAAAVIATIGLVSSGDSSKIIDAINQIGTGLQQVVTGVGVLVGIGSAAYAGWTATHKSQIAAVNAIDGVKVVSDAAPVTTVTVPPKA